MGAVPVTETRYARNGEISLAYQVVGDGPVDLVFVPGFMSHVELAWELPFSALFEELGRHFRLVVMDKRGTGLSDRSLGPATLEDRMDDVRAVMDEVGMDRAALFGVSEGGPMSLLMAASHPDRVSALVLYGSFARIAWAPDYPDGMDVTNVDRYLDHIERTWGTGRPFRAFFGDAPDAEAAMRLIGRLERYACTPAVAREVMRRNYQIDVRAVLPTIQVPTLVLHNRGDPVVRAEWGRYVAERVPGARYVELDADFHVPWADMSWVTDHVVEFLTGARPSHLAESERVLTTVLFTDIVQSTEQAVSLGDLRWREVLDTHDAAVRDELGRHRGTEVNTTGDGFLASFDGPARAIRCAMAICGRVRTLGLEVRAGVHTGECERRGDDLAGIGVHIGARVAAAAGSGEVLVSSTVRDLVVGAGIEFEDRGRQVLKGVPGEWQLLAVSGATNHLHV